MSKQVTLKLGVEKNLKDVTVDIADNTPKPWDGADQLKFIGGKTTRNDGIDKVTGKAKYTFDIQLPGMLYAAFLRSSHSAAVVKSIDISKAEKYPGVKAVMSVTEQWPMAVRFAGQEILAIAAETQHQAEEALKLVSVEYERKPFVVDIEKAKNGKVLVFDETVEEKTTEGDAPGGAAKVSQKGNVRGPRANGNLAQVDAALAGSDVIVEATYTTQVQTHSAMETHGVVVRWDAEDQLTVWASTQGTFSVRDELADVFQLPKTNVRVYTEYMGGGFGAKFGAGVYGVMAAKLAKKAKAPVRLMLNRKEEHLAVGNRPSSVQTFKIGAGKDGKLKAIKLLSYGTAGIGTGAGSAGPARVMYFTIDNVYTEESDVFTNAGPGAAFRAPGFPQGTFALEQTIDELAYKLNMDPLEFRKMNSTADLVRMAEYEIGAKKFGWEKRNPKAAADKGPIKKGYGMANSVWYYITGAGFQAAIQVNSDGSVELTNGVQDIGGGIRTVMAMVTAEELGLQPKDIVVKIGDTQYGLGPASGGSQTTAGITPAVRNAAYLAKMKMLDIAAPLLGVKAEELGLADGKIIVTANPSKSLTWKQVASKIPGDKFTVIGERLKDHLEVRPRLLAGVQFAEVEVDTETGVIKVKRVVAVHDCGRPMNRLTLESQINGGVIQGISYALFENRLLDRNTGLMVNANFDQYKIAGSLDMPEIESVIIDVNNGQSSTGAMGIGEPATVPTAAAIANAFYHATGVRVRELPMTPAAVLKALQG
ncbi:xanthine dehydrogenase family protein molybdopterin-binding subunit [bacterium]|nr:xanthine dehydrogenase family protein molybdopterin-binding subunit [bacterium]